MCSFPVPVFQFQLFLYSFPPVPVFQSSSSFPVQFQLLVVMSSFVEVVNVLYRVVNNIFNRIYVRLNGVCERVGVVEGNAEELSERVDDLGDDLSILTDSVDGLGMRVDGLRTDGDDLTDRVDGVDGS